MNKESVEKFQNNKWWAVFAVGLVYVGAVILFALYYENMMAKQFTGASKIIGSVSSIFVAGYALALPLALHFWAVSGWHKGIAIGLYSLDIVVMSLNVISAAYTGETPPDWVSQWRVISPASIILVLAGIGVLFMADPGQQSLVKLEESITKAKVTIVNKVVEHIESPKGITEIIAPLSGVLAASIMNEKTLLGTPQSIDTQNNTGGTDYDVTNEIQKVLEKAGWNGGSQELAKQISDAFALNPTHASTKK